MTGISVIAEQLQRLPATARRTLYSVVSLTGLVLWVLQLLGWQDLGPISVDQALHIYAVVAPAVGVVAVANVSAPTPDTEEFGQDSGEDVEFSSFGPAAEVDGFSG